MFGHAIVQADYMEPGLVSCLATALPAGNISVVVSNDGSVWSQKVEFVVVGEERSIQKVVVGMVVLAAVFVGLVWMCCTKAVRKKHLDDGQVFRAEHLKIFKR
jgi:uncharacterized OB-fold protein